MTSLPSLVPLSLPMLMQPSIPIPSILQFVEKILQDINQQVLDTKYTKNLGQLIKITLKLRQYLTQKYKTMKPLVSKLIHVLIISVVTINHHMVI